MVEFREITQEDVLYNLINLRQLVFEVTENCNLKCKYCGYSQFYQEVDTRNSGNMTFDRAKKIIDYLYDLWSNHNCKDVLQRTAVSFYGGEPLMNIALIKKIITYMESLPSVGRFFTYSMTTNAMLLDIHMDYLVEKNFQLLISLDGNKEGHSYRIDCKGNNSFDKVLKNVKLLQSKYPHYFGKHVSFNSVLHNRNSAESIYEFISNEFGKRPHISSLNTSGIRKDKLDEFNKTYQSLYSSISQSCSKELEDNLFTDNPQTYNIVEYMFRSSGNIYRSYYELIIDKDRLKTFPTGTCVPFYKKMFITVNGQILPCERVNYNFSFGYVDDEVHINLSSVAKKHNEFIFKYINKCFSCSQRKTCSICIYQSNSVIDGSFSGCEFYRAIREKKEIDVNGLMYLNQHPYLYLKILNELTIIE
ncbi:radical SAM peptide maturase [Bacteroides sp. 519]|uniref:radical SAM peptide maturase n=1 Tax=Bacteroides sp. 519 TaxID=2302937 RepID=UPI0013CF6735|nr:radical SAM peptide maturase [Bacteroides sp. 519]NDV60768.1 radical SAM peptide maturase [Bacteroides sp. 519]